MNLLDLNNLNTSHLKDLYSLTDDIKLNQAKYSNTLNGKTILSCFFEPSTRTQISFEMAVRKLGGNFIKFDPNLSSLKKSESIIDTLKTFKEYQPDFLIIRSPYSGMAQIAANILSNTHIINAGDGMNSHPTQALIDSYTILKRLNTINNLKIGICGDIIRNRVAHSNIELLGKILNNKIYLIAPPSMLPKFISQDYKIYHNINCLKDINLDVLMSLRIQNERKKIAFNLQDYKKNYQINENALNIEKIPIILHPGPVNINIEITEEVLNYKNIMINEQVKNSIYMRQAIMYFLMNPSLN